MPGLAVTGVRFGAYGKAPGFGDFFGFGLPAPFIAVWDDWLQHGLLAAEAARGPGWRSRFMTAPIWRFTLAGGLAGPAAMIGVLTPSVDRVGRAFPLTLAAALPPGCPPACAHFAAEAVFARLEETALAALDERTTRDDLERRLAQVDPPAPRPGQPPGQPPAAPRAGVLARIGPAADPLPEFAGHLVGALLAAPSLWSAQADGATRLILCDGLPAPAVAAGFFGAGSDPETAEAQG